MRPEAVAPSPADLDWGEDDNWCERNFISFMLGALVIAAVLYLMSLG